MPTSSRVAITKHCNHPFARLRISELLSDSFAWFEHLGCGCHVFGGISDRSRTHARGVHARLESRWIQTTDPQRDALLVAGIHEEQLYQDHASGKKDDRPGLAACLKSLRAGDTLVVWKLDRLGRDLHHLVNTVHDLTARGVGLKVLTGQGAAIDTTTAAGKLVFGIFAALAEFERELISERTVAGLASARARGRVGGRPFTMTPAKVRTAMAAMGKPETNVGELCKELGISRQTLYRHVSPSGEVRADGTRVLNRKATTSRTL